MKTDRELLELAAKAAGYVIEWCPQWCGGSGGYMKTVIPTHVDPVLSTSLHWNPLVDDGDALRLSMKLKIRVLHPAVEAPDAVRAGSFQYGFVQEDYADHDGDYMAAARRAITRAAAQTQEEKEKAK